MDDAPERVVSEDDGVDMPPNEEGQNSSDALEIAPSTTLVEVTPGVAVVWPDTGGAKQFHLEFMVDDLDKAAAALRAVGAGQPEFQPGGTRFRVLTDPAGHPSCIIDRAVAGAD